MYCDHCQKAFTQGEEVLLCADGAVLHQHCKVEYALQQLMPLPMKVEEAMGAA